MNIARNKAIVILLFVVVAIYAIITRFSVSTDLGLFLPEPETKFERLLRHQLDNGASTNIILIAFSGLPEKQLAQFNLTFVDELSQSEKFAKVTNNASTLSDDALGFLEEHRYLLTHQDLSKQFSAPGFRAALQDRLDGLASSSAPIEKRFLQKDPTGEILSLLGDWQGKISRHKKPEEAHGVWFSQDRKRTLVLVEIGIDVTDMNNQIAAVAEIRSTFETLARPGLEVTMAGPSVFAVESGEDIRQDIRILTIMAVVMVVLFLWTAYRSIRMVLLIVFPLLIGIVVAIASILLFRDQVHGITLAFGVTLAGVAVDYPIHLLTGMKGGGEKRQEKLKKIWRTLRLGVVSTVVAYGAFLLSGFGGLQQLGAFTMVGLITAALFSRWVLPFFAKGQIGTEFGLTGFHSMLKYFGQSASRFRILVISMLLVSLAGLMIYNKPILHLNVDSLSPISDQRRAEGKLLRGDLGFWYGGSLMLITAADDEKVLQLSEYIEPFMEELVASNILEGFDMASHFLPSRERQSLRKEQAKDIKLIKDNLHEALADFPFRENVFEPFIDDIESLGKLELVDIESLQETAVGKKLSPLLFEFDGEAAGVALLHGVQDDAAMREFADQYDGVYYMHLKSASTEMVTKSVNRVAISMMICILIIYVSLVMGFKSFSRPLKILVPTFSAAVTTAAILVFTGNPLSIFHLISLLLVVGLGLDYALFFNRLPDNSDEWDTTFRSLWVCGITTILVFGVLTFSKTPPLEAIGLTVGVGAFISMVFAAMWAASPDKPASAKLAN